MLACDMTIALCLTSLCVYRQINSYQPPSGDLSITRSASGGSARDLRRQQVQGVPSPQKVASLRPRASGLLAIAKSCGYFSGAPPSIPPCGFAVLVIPGKKADFAPTGAVCRSCTTLPVSIRAPPPGGKGGTPFPDLKYPAPAPCRSGSKGEAPWSLRKERNPGSGNLHTV